MSTMVKPQASEENMGASAAADSACVAELGLRISHQTEVHQLPELKKPPDESLMYKVCGLARTD